MNLSVSLVSTILIWACAQVFASDLVITPRPTAEKIAQLKKNNGENFSAAALVQAARRNEAARALAKKEGPALKKPRAGLIARSTILTNGKSWTLVPKGAVLHVPERYRLRIGKAPVGVLQTWAEFYRMNRGWLHRYDVTFTEARGENFISPAATAAYRGTGRIVVAVCQAGPISIKKEAFLPSRSAATSNNAKN